MSNFLATRRQFLKIASAFAPLGAAAPFAFDLASMSAHAADAASDYKALVCIMLAGGNDCHNTVMATDAESWDRYWKARWVGADPIALMPIGKAPLATRAESDLKNPDGSAREVKPSSPERWGGVIPITSGQAVHPLLKSLFGSESPWSQRRLAVLANVGPLVEPTTKAGMVSRTVRVPHSLLSHNDQVAIWQSSMLEGARTGWGGAMADAMTSANVRSTFAAISASGNSLFAAGRETIQKPIRSSDPAATTINNTAQGANPFGSSNGVASASLREMVQAARAVSDFEDDYAEITRRALSDAATLNAAVAKSTGAAALTTIPDPVTGNLNTTLAAQLRMIIRIMKVAPELGVRRQVFFVSIGGFDTHGSQNTSHSRLMAQLDYALSYFDAQTRALDLADKVTLFTMSDFGRTFTSNGSGTDHGWGAHHLVLGGAVAGGRIFGAFPTLGVDGQSPGFQNPDMLGRVLIPSTSVFEYATTLGRWFGLSETQLRTIFPSLSRFGQENIDFLPRPIS